MTILTSSLTQSKPVIHEALTINLYLDGLLRKGDLIERQGKYYIITEVATNHLKIKDIRDNGEVDLNYLELGEFKNLSLQPTLINWNVGVENVQYTETDEGGLQPTDMQVDPRLVEQIVFDSVRLLVESAAWKDKFLTTEFSDVVVYDPGGENEVRQYGNEIVKSLGYSFNGHHQISIIFEMIPGVLPSEIISDLNGIIYKKLEKLMLKPISL